MAFAAAAAASDIDFSCACFNAKLAEGEEDTADDEDEGERFVGVFEFVDRLLVVVGVSVCFRFLS